MAKKEIRHSELVSESQNIDTPYELPEGWKWCRLGDVAEKLIDGDHNPPKGLTEKTEYLMASSRNINNNELIELENVRYLSKETFETENKRTKLKIGDILFTSVGSLGRSCIFNGGYNLCFQRSVSVISTTQNNYFVKFYFDSPFYQKYVQEHSTGTAQMGFYLKEMSNSPIPLPPTIAEQQRIVNRIETMFAKLDEAKEKAQNVLDSFETRKAAILHKAFTGELTANWRKENGVSDDSWKEKTLGEIASKITDGEHSTPKRVDEFCGYYLLSARNIHNGEILLDDVDYVAKDEYERIRKRCNPDKSDILISCSGSVGRVCVIQDDNKYVMVRSAAMVKLEHENPFYVAYMLQSFNVQQQIERTKKQSCQANLFLGAIKELTIPLPTYTEQIEIVIIIDRIRENEEKAKQAAEIVLQQIDILKKSILARAFRGEI